MCKSLYRGVMPRAPRPARRRSPSPALGPADRALADAAELVGDRWSLLVVSRLLRGPRRFGDLLDELDGLAPNILARRLARLEADGVVVGEPYSTRPVRHAYRLTARGSDLGGAVRMLAGWGARADAGRSGGGEGTPLHGTCGSPLEVRWFCSTCDGVVAEPAPGDGSPGDDDLLWV
jgi:DNA-binding HxlR family transcriptional regulator